MTPLQWLTRPVDALAAHERQPAGKAHRLLLDDPETKEEIRAERQRRNVAERHRRHRLRRLAEAEARAT